MTKFLLKVDSCLQKVSCSKTKDLSKLKNSSFLLGDQGGLCNVLYYSEGVQSKAKNPLKEMNDLDIRFPYEMPNKEEHLE